MTSNHHTPVTSEQSVNKTNSEAPLAELDQVITNILDGTQAFSKLLIGTPSGSLIDEYATGNQDAYASLQGGDGAGGTIDTAASGTVQPLGDIAGSEYQQAQSFIPSAGLFKQFEVQFSTNTGSPTGDCTWTIEGDSSGPDGTAIATGTFTPVVSSVNTVTVPENQRVFLDGATTYWITFTVPAQSSGNRYNLVGQTTSSYANGQRARQINGGGWVTQSDDLDLTVTTVALDFGEQLAQGIQLSSASEISPIKLYLRKVGSPTDNLTVEIQADSSGDPSGTPVTNGTSDIVLASTLSSDFGFIEFAFSTSPSLSASTQYHIVLKTDGSQSDTDFVIWGTDASSPSYAGGQLKSYNGSTWDAEGDDTIFQIYGLAGLDSANLQVYSTTKGVLPPRMTTTQRTALTPPAGTIVYDTTLNAMYLYTSSWAELVAIDLSTVALDEIVAPTNVSSQSSVSITIPSGYKDIMILFTAQSNAASAPFEMRVQINSDTGTNYRVRIEAWDTFTPTNDNAANGIDVPIGDAGNSDYWSYTFWLYNYLDTGDYRGGYFEGAIITDDSTLGSQSDRFGGFYWENNADAITSVQLKENNSSDWNGEYAVYGLK